jgi:hypothetical protein
MIRNEAEYQAAVAKLDAEAQRLDEHRSRLNAAGFAEEEVKRLMDPLMSFHLQLGEEVESYERLRRGEFTELHNFRGFGQLLVALRIAKGISQRDLANRLGVHESLVSRDERNEYHAITIERAVRILDALGAHLRTTVETEPLSDVA